MNTRLARGVFWTLFAVCVALRLPSLQQPAGADQALYGYVGQRILHGELPYRDAWDQKPPGIHATYAVLWAIWPDERVVPAADLVVAVVTALLLLALGRRLGPPGAGEVAALVFLFLGDPAWGRLGGVRARAQSEVFIGLVSTAGLLLLHRALDAGTKRVQALGFAAGALFGCAFVYKYNAGAVLIAATLAALWWWRRDDASTLLARVRGLLPAGVAVASGFVTVVATMLAIFAIAGAFDDLYHATISYNVFYSGETYASRFAMLGYLLRFPIERARVDGLWFVGGLGCAVILVTALVRRTRAGHAGPPAGAVGGGRVPVDRGERQPRPAAVLPAGGARASRSPSGSPRPGPCRASAGRGACWRSRSSPSACSASSTSTRSPTTCGGT